MTEPALVAEAAAADGKAMTFAELRAFMDQAAASVPDGNIRIRATVTTRGDIDKVIALAPPPDHRSGAELPGDVPRDAVALLEAAHREDVPAAITLFASATAQHSWAVASFLARECLRLARAVYGDDLSGYFAWFRNWGNAFDAAAGEPE